MAEGEKAISVDAGNGPIKNNATFSKSERSSLEALTATVRVINVKG